MKSLENKVLSALLVVFLFSSQAIGDENSEEKPYLLTAANGDTRFELIHSDNGNLIRFTHFYENGNKWTVSHLKDGKLHGLYTAWHDNGQKSQESHYNEGIRDGLATYWQKDGKKTTEIRYKDGTRVSHKTF